MATRGLHTLDSRRNRRIGAWQFIAALVCLVAQATAMGHLLFVEHATCLEHGETIHVDGLHAESEVLSSSESAGWTSIPTDAIADAHEHCLTIVDERRRALLSLPVATPGAPPGIVGCVESVAPSSWVGSSIYRFAPKTSPPV
jgi:hypothetical protein